LIALAIVVVVLGIAYVVGQRYTSDLYALAPGSAPPAGDYITVKPPTTVHVHKGKILLVTVSERTVGPIDYLLDKTNPDIQIVQIKKLTGNSKPSQLNLQNQVDMQDSTQTAPITSLGVEVESVEVQTPADGHLQPGDVITALDGTATTTSAALVTAIRSHQPGDAVRLSVQSVTGTRTESLVLAPSPPSQGPPHPIIGISTKTKVKADLPVDVNINAGPIGGPSAGLAFTLALINELSSSDLTGGQVIAATGTIEPDGTVGDVGGVTQKTAAVRKAHCVAFLVPPGEYQEAVRHAGSHLKVIKVANLGDALVALGSLGGDLSALGPAPAATG
jgi:PDZ domain-containing protein